MKKILSIILTLSIIICVFSFTANAESPSQIAVSNNNCNIFDIIECYDISEIGNLPIEKTYTYDEMVAHYVSSGMTYSEAIEHMGPRPLNRSSDIRYSSIGMKQFVYTENLTTYILQAKFVVGLRYYSGSVSPDSIAVLKDGHIYTGAGHDCVFDGTLSYTLTSGNRFHYSFNGNIYKKGTSNWQLGGQINIGGTISVSGSVSNPDGFVENVSEFEESYSAGMNP